MVEEFLKALCVEWGISPPTKPPIGAPFKLLLKGGGEVLFRDLEPGLFLEAPIGKVRTLKREELLIFLMRANLLGQGTGGASIGMDEKEGLTLSLGFPYEISYETFKEKLEEFVNYLSYWKEEIQK